MIEHARRPCWVRLSGAVALLLASAPTLAQSPTPTQGFLPPGKKVTLRGIVQEKGSGAAVPGINVYMLPHGLKAVTDAKGEFEIAGMPEGEFRWSITANGFERIEVPDDQYEGAPNPPRKIRIERRASRIYETTVLARTRRRDEKTRVLRGAELAKIPGSGGDPVKAVQNLPGVNRSRSFNAQVIIEGSAPQDTKYLLDGHEVPIIFHFGGLSSVVLPEALDRVDYLSAGYGPEYGRAIGGLVGGVSRAPKRDRYQAMAFADIINAGALAEGPLGEDGGFLLAGRYSYISLVISALASGSKDFNFTVAPQYSDATAIFEKQLTPIDSLRVFGTGSVDALEFVLNTPSGQDPSIRGKFSNKTAFFRLIPQVTHRHSGITVSRWSLGLGRDWSRLDLSDNYWRYTNYSLSTRLETERRMSEAWSLLGGVDSRHTWHEIELEFAVPSEQGGIFNSLSSAEKTRERIRPVTHEAGLYAKTVIRPSEGWSLKPGARLDYFSQTREALPAPRAAIRRDLGESAHLRASGGYYGQPPQPHEIDPALGNPEVKSPRAWHATFGAEKDLRGTSSRGFILSSDLFHKWMSRLVISSSKKGERYNNDGKGRAYGLESMLKLEGEPWTGWIAYTLSRSLRTEPSRGEHLFQYDQTHILTAVAAFDFGRNWRISSRFRYTTGSPTTPITGAVFDADHDVFQPIRGPYYSSRLDPFVSLDLRLDKKWVFDSWSLSAYAEVQNVTNHKNAEAIRYSYDYSKEEKITLLPVLPSIGLKGEF